MTLFPFLKPDTIREEAERFLADHHSEGTPPVPIEEIITEQLGIEIIPVKGLFSSLNIDGFLDPSGTQLYIDEDMYLNSYNRARYTMAHELGHRVLHQKQFRRIPIKSTADWMKFMLSQKQDHQYAEVQANMFAAQVLLPPDALGKKYRDQLKKLSPDLQRVDENTLAEYVAKFIARDFVVSEDAAKNRLKNWHKYGF